MTASIDLNADLGEDESPAAISRDIAIMDVISSCNIACGGHAGSAHTMRTMLAAAQSRGVKAGAHPSYPDRLGFGRRSMAMPPADLRRSLTSQIQQISELADELGVTMSHIKPHGALYNDAQDDPALASLIAEIAAEAGLALVGMAGSHVAKFADERAIEFVAEAFIDRRYTSQGRLVPRGNAGAVIAVEAERIAQGLALACGAQLTSEDGAKLQIAAQTLCLHSDSDGALDSAKQMRNALEAAGIAIRPAT